MPDIGIVLLEGYHLSAVGCATDAFWLARRHVDDSLSAVGHDLRMKSEVLLLSTNSHEEVLSADGRLLRTDKSIADGPLLRMAYIASFTLEPDHLTELFERERAAIRWIASLAAQGVPIGGGGAAVFLIAEAGVLDHGRASVPADLAGLFRRRYPDIGIDAGESVVANGHIYTAGALAAQLPLAARLVAVSGSFWLGQWLASATGVTRDQPGGWKLSDDPIVAAAQQWIAEHYQRPLTIGDLAVTLGVSHKTLIRHFSADRGMTPLAYLQMVRIENARRMLALTSLSIDQIASAAGYQDVSSFRRLFARHLGLNPAAYRASLAFASPLHEPPLFPPPPPHF